MVMEKISEAEALWNFDWIYLSTEDQEIWEISSPRNDRKVSLMIQEQSGCLSKT